MLRAATPGDLFAIEALRRADPRPAVQNLVRNHGNIGDILTLKHI